MNHVRSALFAAALISLGVCAGGPAFAQKPDATEARRYRVAVVRADGVLVPFAEHDNGDWRAVWSGVERGRTYDRPLTLHDVTPRWWGSDGPALRWWLWQRPGIAEGLAVTGLRAVAMPCQSDVGLVSGYASPLPLPAATFTPFPKAGLATTAAIDYEPIVALPKDGPIWPRIEAAVAREFPRAEQMALYDMRWAHPTPSRERQQAPLDVQKVWHVAGEPFYYYEAMRRYPERNPPRDEEPCDLVTYVAGYLWDNGRGELISAGSDALVSYCHLERAVFMWPLGAIREGARTYWVVQMAGWNAESYSVVETAPAAGQVRPRLSRADGCPF